MTIYIDLVFILNLVFDYLLLLVVNIVLKRFVNLKKVLLGSLVGATSIFFLFIKLNSLELFLLKIVLSYFMITITFGYKNFKYTITNMFYLYFTSILLGGFLYYLNLEFSLKNEGLLFYYDGLKINAIFLIMCSPIILFFYIKQSKNNITKYQNYYLVKVTMMDNKIKYLKGYYDTGNRLRDPVFNKPIVIVNDNELYSSYQVIYVPYTTINKKSIMKCLRIKSISFNDNVYKKVLLGISENKINMDGIDCILNGLLER